jgi:hypothetical protein
MPESELSHCDQRRDIGRSHLRIRRNLNCQKEAAMKTDEATSLNLRDGSNELASDQVHEQGHGQSEHLLEVIDASNARNCNTSHNRPFAEVLKSRASRRAVLAGGLGLAASTFFSPRGTRACPRSKEGLGQAAQTAQAAQAAGRLHSRNGRRRRRADAFHLAGP